MNADTKRRLARDLLDAQMASEDLCKYLAETPPTRLSVAQAAGAASRARDALQAALLRFGDDR